MKNCLLTCTLVLIIASVQLNAQNIPQGIASGYSSYKYQSADKQPVVLQSVREADVMWSKVVWRRIDLRERMNHQLFYPTEPIPGRKSFIQILVEGIERQQVKAYDPSTASAEFNDQLTFTAVEERCGVRDETISIEDPEWGELRDTIIRGSLNLTEVKELLVKEVWFFDKQRSVMEARIIGICPVRHFAKGDNDEEISKRMLFWVSYDEIRPLLAKQEVFNPRNQNGQLTYDDLFVKRYFSSHIFREANAYNNRDIVEYTVGEEALYEADRIKNQIINYECDLWQY